MYMITQKANLYNKLILHSVFHFILKLSFDYREMEFDSDAFCDGVLGSLLFPGFQEGIIMMIK